MADFYCIPTTLGLIKLASAANGGAPVEIIEFAVGDANGAPYLPQTRVNELDLLNEQYRASLESVTVSPTDASVYIAKIKIPANVGGFYVCEIALIDTDGDIIYLANYPYNYKPTLTQGAGGELVIPVYLQSSAADTITIVQNPNVITLSQAEADERYAFRNGSSDQKFKVSDAVNLDEAVSLAQLISQKNGYFNTPILTLTDGQTDSFVLTPNQIVRILLVGGGAGGGMCNENSSGVNDYSGHPNNGIAEDGTPSTVEIDHLSLVVARADNGTGGKSGMRDTGGGASPYNGYTGTHGGAWAHSGYTILLGAQIDHRESPRYQSMPRLYPYQAYRINGTPLDNYGRGGDGAATAGTIGFGGIGGCGGNGGIVEFLIKNNGLTDITLNLTAGTKGRGYYQNIFGDNYPGHDGTGGLVLVYA